MRNNNNPIINSSSSYERASERSINIYDRIEDLRDNQSNAASTFRESKSVEVSTYLDYQKPNLTSNQIKNKKSCLKIFKNRKFIIAASVAASLLALIVIGVVIFLVLFLNGKFQLKFAISINNFSINNTKSTTSSTTREPIIEDSKYGEYCSLLQKKFCKETDNLECSVELKCACKKDFYFNNIMCGIYIEF